MQMARQMAKVSVLRPARGAQAARVRQAVAAAPAPRVRQPAASRLARPRQAVGSQGDGLQSLTTGFRILDALTQSPGPMGLTDIAAAVGELKPRVHRHLSTMKSLGVVFQ